ncbi:MAG: alpha-glucan family phosphorylase, partial [Actinomycetia bacterium]|nr:alpha-glucan family phosphorylase [Actinomycetes bacterium]
MRISQEIILGIGGVKTLKALGIEPDVWHMNEGHSVFLGLERIRNKVKEQGINFYEALEAVRSNTIFTTHTPVPAGNDAFPLTLKDKFFQKYWQEVGINRHNFMDLGLQVQPEGYEIFSLTILAFKLSGRANGVSELHGKVSRHIWKRMWPFIPEEEIPIIHITNGIHTFSWLSKEMSALYDKYLSKDWKDYITHPEIWEKVEEIPDKDMWDTRLKIKEKMFKYLSHKLKSQCRRNEEHPKMIKCYEDIFSTKALVIGFARRFATYKRATLIFENKERLLKLLSDPDRPVYLVFAGKAHPADEPGQALIKEIYDISRSPEFFGKVFFIEDYNIKLAKKLVHGVDVWLNTPRRPLEASGTSGQKVPVNGGLNLSILDGWWCEGYNGENGWAIGTEEENIGHEQQDRIDRESLYDILEYEVIPAFFERDENGLPQKWIKLMKNSIKSVIPKFSTDRMVKDYADKL